MATSPRIEIEKGVPPPVRGSGRTKYPWGEMEVGDSFFVPGCKAVALSNCVGSWRKYHKSSKKFTTRTVDGGARAWRIA